jgi:hypothetical protein
MAYDENDISRINFTDKVLRDAKMARRTVNNAQSQQNNAEMITGDYLSIFYKMIFSIKNNRKNGDRRNKSPCSKWERFGITKS